jgi:hypothetical protein
MPFPFEASLRDRRILVAVTSRRVAQELTDVLERQGAHVLGPVSTITDAQRLAGEATDLSAAVLDTTLRGETVWPVADALIQRHVALLFVTEGRSHPIRARYGQAQVVEKPVPAGLVARLLAAQTQAPARAAASRSLAGT